MRRGSAGADNTCMRRPSPFACLLAAGVACSLGALGVRGASLSAAPPLPEASATLVTTPPPAHVPPRDVTQPTPAAMVTATPTVPADAVTGPASLAEAAVSDGTPAVPPAPTPVPAPRSQVGTLPGPGAAPVPGLAAPGMSATLFERMNGARAEANLPPLERDAALEEVAMTRARDLVGKHYFDHVAPDGESAFGELAARGISYRLAGENLARNTYPATATADAAFQALMGSPGHRANILEARFGSAGVACLQDGNAWVYVTVFTD